MIGILVVLRASAALVGLVFAAVLLPARRTRSALWLAAFLLLVALNQGAETLRAAGTADERDLLRVAAASASLDPLALLLFAFSLAPAASRPDRISKVVAAVAFSLAAWAIVSPQAATFAPLYVAIAAMTATVYLGLLWWCLSRVLEEPQRGAWTSVFCAVAMLAIPIGIPLSDQLVALGAPLFSDPLSLSLNVVMSLVIAGGVVALSLARIQRHGTPAPIARALRGALWGSLGLVVILKASDIDTVVSAWAGLPFTGELVLVGRSGGAIRSLLFGGLASRAVFRDDALGLSLRARRAASRALIAVVAVIALATVLPLVELAALGRIDAPTPLEGALLLGALLLSQGFRQSIDGVALRVYGVPRPGDRAAAEQAFRTAVASAVVAGRDIKKDAELARLAAELGLDEATTDLLARLAESGVDARLTEDAVVGGRYRVTSFLGAGGGGRSFLATDGLLSRKVVLKELHALGDPESAALAEARVVSGLKHPAIRSVLDAFRRGSRWIIVLEYIEGPTLEEALQAGATSLPTDRASIVRDVLDALAAAHRNDIVHGDLKASNILLSRDGRALISDFGLARMSAGATQKLAGDAVEGTWAILAPEQRRGAPASKLSDVYQAGLLAQRVLDDPARASARAWIARATAEAPASRFADAIEMRAAFAAIAPHQRQ